MKPNRPILLVGGGTGGHIFPLVAVAEGLEQKKKPFIFIGEKGGREEKIVEEYRWDFRPIWAGKWRRQFDLIALWQNIVDLGRSAVGFFQAFGIVGASRARVVFSKGGYVALPVVLAARLLGKKIIIHESDSVMGLTNRLSARLATRVIVAFEPSIFPQATEKYVRLGIPIRRALRQAARLSSPKKSRPLILVLGGIQGSVAINKLVRESLPDLIALADVIHVTGETDYLQHRSLANKLPAKLRSTYRPFPSLNRELAYYYQSANLVISRAGVTTVVEAALFGRAVYLIPLPTSAGNHQLRNARILSMAGAARVGEEKELNREVFVSDIRELLSNTENLTRMGANLRDYFNSGSATEEIVEEILKYA